LYLNDNCVDAWAGVTYRQGIQLWDVLVFPSLLTTDMLRRVPGSLAMAEFKRKIGRLAEHLVGKGSIAEAIYQLRAWVLPRCIPRSDHWTSILVDFEARLVLFVDSIGSSNGTVTRQVWTILEAASQALLNRPFDFTGWSWGSLGVLSLQQGNGYDCAIFCPILLARSIAHRVSLRSGHGRCSNLELDRHRDLITRELLTGRVLSSSR